MPAIPRLPKTSTIEHFVPSVFPTPSQTHEHSTHYRRPVHHLDEPQSPHRWFGSATETANEGRAADEGLSYVVVANERFTLRDAIAESGTGIIGKTMRDRCGKWPVYPKFGPQVNPDASAIVAYRHQ